MKAGVWYEFTVGKRIFLPEPHLVLTGPDGMKHLLPLVYYPHYAFTPGNIIRCRVDKINCSGRVYLEPENPRYRENEWYRFRFLHAESWTTPFGIVERGWVLGDEEGETHFTPVDAAFFGSFRPAAHIDGQVARIKKGKPVIRHAWSAAPPAGNENAWDTYTVLPGFLNVSGEAYFRLANGSKEIYFLKKNDYDRYSLQAGAVIRAMTVKWKAGRGWIIEPEHPVYQAGETYFFPLAADGPGPLVREDNLRVRDVFGDEVLVVVERERMNKVVEAGEVRLTVTGLRKGKPLLAWPEG